MAIHRGGTRSRRSLVVVAVFSVCLLLKDVELELIVFVVLYLVPILEHGNKAADGATAEFGLTFSATLAPAPAASYDR